MAEIKLKSTKTFKQTNASLNYKVLFAKSPEVKQDDTKIQEKKRKKSTWIFLLLNICIVGAILIYTLLTQEVKPIGELLKEDPYYRFLTIGLLVMGGVYVIEATCYSLLFKKTTGKFNFCLGLKTAIIGKYWENITPMGSGGQIAQVAYVRGKGISSDVTTSVVVGKHLTYQIAFLILGIIATCLPFDLFNSGEIIKTLAIIALSINLFLFAFTLLVSTSKKACSILVIGGIKLLIKLKIIKNYRKALLKSLTFVKEYQKSIKSFAKNPFLVITEILLNAISIISVASVSYFIYLIFHPLGGVNGVKIMVMAFLCTFTSAIIPIPGGSGVAEISFVAMFGQLFTEGTTFWALLFWRILTYYLYVLVGFLFTMLEPVVMRRKLAKIPTSKRKINNKAVVIEENITEDDNMEQDNE